LYCTGSGIITPIGGRPVHRLREDYVVNTVVMWLHILGPYWYTYGALFGSINHTPMYF